MSCIGASVKVPIPAIPGGLSGSFTPPALVADPTLCCQITALSVVPATIPFAVPIPGPVVDALAAAEAVIEAAMEVLAFNVDCPAD